MRHILLLMLTSALARPAIAEQLFVADAFGNTIDRYDAATGHLLGTIGGPELKEPSALTMGAGGDLFVSDSQDNQILRYSAASGAFKGVFSQGSSSADLTLATDMAFGPDGDLFVVSSQFVLRFDGNTGLSKGVFASINAGLGGQGLTFGPGGDLFVSMLPDLGAVGHVYRFDGNSGAFKSFFADTGGFGVKFGPGNDLFVASGQVLRFDGTSGASKGTFTSGGPLGEANLIAFGPGADLFVTDLDGSQVLRYDGTTGAFESVVASFAPGHFAAGIALSPNLPLLGDANFDGVVNFTDLLILAQHYGRGPGEIFADGDFNEDGKVDFADLLVLAQHYGQSSQTATAGVSSVPEPMLLLATVACGILIRRRRTDIA